MSALNNRALKPGPLFITAIFGLNAFSHADPKVFTEKLDGRVIVKFENSNLCPETITVEATLTNMTCGKALPFTVEVAPGTSGELCTFTRVQSGKAWHYDYKWKSQMGSATARHDEDVVYRFPYPAGVSYPVMQGHLGTFSHNGELSYALDWRMPEGSKVCAARSGRVIRLKADSDESGPTADFKKLANFIVIQHADGTLGEYLHLQKNGVLVKLGDQVRAGDVIALSGNTGFSTGPHLHFHVKTPVDGTEIRTIPVKFRSIGNTAILPRQGKSYESL